MNKKQKAIAVFLGMKDEWAKTGSGTDAEWEAVNSAITALSLDWEKITTAHEQIGYERGFNDGYAQAVDDYESKGKEGQNV